MRLERTGALSPPQVVALTVLFVIVIGTLMGIGLRAEHPRVRTSRAFEAVQESVEDQRTAYQQEQEAKQSSPLPVGSPGP